MQRPARSSRGARWAFLALGVLAGAPGLAQGPPDGPGPLPWRVKGEVGFTVDAAAFPESAQWSLEVYVRLSPATLAELHRDSLDQSRVRLSARLANRFGARKHEAMQEFAVDPVPTGPGFGRVVFLKFPVSPGSYRLRVKLEDLMSRKRGIAFVGRNVPYSTQVEGDVEIPKAVDRTELSNPEFVWSEIRGSQAGAFRRIEGDSGTTGLLPNPDRLYGLLSADLRVGFVARAPGEERPWRWHARVLDPSGAVVASRESTTVATARVEPLAVLDVSTLPAGGYDLELSVQRDGEERSHTRRAHFGVAWQPETWRRSPRDVQDEVHFLLSAEEEEDFGQLHPGEQERYLQDYWKARDPSPETAENEARLDFLKRVEHANRTYSGAGPSRGMFSDMGRVHIRHGEPDEILRQVIPAGDQTLSQALQMLELTEDRITGDVAQKSRGGDVRPFEIWVYDERRDVHPSGIRAGANPPRRKRLTFLFVDEQGYGHYTLRYSTE